MPKRIDCLMVAQEVFDEVPPCLPVSLGGSSERGEDPLFGYVGAGPRRFPESDAALPLCGKYTGG